MIGWLRRLVLGSTPRCRVRHHSFHAYRCRAIAGHDGRHNFGWARFDNLTLDLDVEIVTTSRLPRPPGLDFDG